MIRVVVDASAMAAIFFQEEGFEQVVHRLKGASLHAPDLLRAELTNVAVKKARRNPRTSPELFERLAEGVGRLKQVRWHDVQPTDVAVVASLTGLSAYDATYLWLAGWLGADLVTLDRRLLAVQGMPVEA